MRRKALLAGNEDGVVMALCLITLVVLTLIGILAMTTSRLEAEISGNDKTSKEALYAAEMALIVGETVVENLISRVALEEDTTPGHYAKDTQPAWHALVWNNTYSAVVAAVPSGLSKVSALPRYTIEEWNLRRDSLTTGIGIAKGVYQFDITARGTGSNITSEIVLQSIYAKRYN